MISGSTTVAVEAKLVDTRSGLLLWKGDGPAQQGSNGGGGGILADLVAAAITRASSSKTDPAHQASRLANQLLFFKKKAGLPFGPYNPKYGKSP